MNPLKALDEIRAAERGDTAERFRELVAESGLSVDELEATVGTLNIAFRKFLEAHNASSELARCSFCQRTQREVKTLIAATQAAICDECIEIARDTAQRPKDGTAKRSWFSWR